MREKAIETPDYMQTYERELKSWRESRKNPPRPKIPKITPDETVMMPMRDGVTLFTEIFFPENAVGPFPTILIRTPYPDSTYPFSARPIDLFRGAGYAVAIQSCRGAWKSQGRFRWYQNEAEDGYDSIEWLAEQIWSNGKIGTYGSSYGGSVQWLAARLRPPHLTCMAPQSPAGMFFYETPYIGGVLFKHHVLTWPRLVTRHSWQAMGFDWDDWPPKKADPESALSQAMTQSPNIEALRSWHGTDPQMLEALGEVLSHPTLDDWWNRIMLTPDVAGGIDIPIFAITGFHDGDQAGCLFNWSLVESNQWSAAGRRHLLIGPWRHAQMATGKTAPMGEVRFESNADVALPKLILRFFDAYMKGDAAARAALPRRCRLYTTGSNEWHEVSNYPPRESTQLALYLSSGGHANSLFGDGRLAFEIPQHEPADQMHTDWRLPVPPVGIGEDARDNEARYDVLVYTSPPLEEDLTVLGPVHAEIHLAANAPDCDVIVRIEDVRPDGAAINMTGEFGFGSFRARYREGFEREVLLTPGESARLAFHVCHMGHVFREGHRIRAAISATVANVLEPNHHTGEPVTTAEKRRVVVETIFHDPIHPSRILLPVFHAGASHGTIETDDSH